MLKLKLKKSRKKCGYIIEWNDPTKDCGLPKNHKSLHVPSYYVMLRQIFQLKISEDRKQNGLEPQHRAGQTEGKTK